MQLDKIIYAVCARLLRDDVVFKEEACAKCDGLQEFLGGDQITVITRLSECVDIPEFTSNYLLSNQRDTLVDSVWAGYVAKTKDSPRPGEGVGAAASITERVGPSIWKYLHDSAASWDLSLESQVEILRNVEKRTPCGECRRSWVSMLADTPAPSDSQKSFFEWTVRIHNRVNEKLGKPLFSADQLTNRA